MKDFLKIDKFGRAPIYKQMVDSIETAARSGALSDGDMLPSMNELALLLDISKETVKKSYGILCDRGILEPRQGRGFFVRLRADARQRRILMLLDRLSPYRQALLDEFSATVGPDSQITILLHNQSTELLKYYLDRHLGEYDYYVVTPHFPLDAQSQKVVCHQLGRIPNRKLILADRCPEDMQGNSGAVYQDYACDAAAALSTAEEELMKYPEIDVFTMPNSLYGEMVESSIRSFCEGAGLKMRVHRDITPDAIHRNQVCLLVNSQADKALFSVNRIAAQKGLEIGSDIKLISYNESPINELVFGGLSTMSADFVNMGRQCAQMILDGKMSKVKADFHLIRRKTF